MSEISEIDSVGRFDARYLAFLETIAQLRPHLHRYCARMTGSIMDGEDVVQDALFEAYRKLDQYDERRPLTPWLFRIAHNRCIDYLRKRGVRDEAEAAASVPDHVLPVDPVLFGLGQAVEHLVISLPPKERACILLKDVFDYTLEEIADLIGSNVGAIKAALNRGRTKLASLSDMPRPQQKVSSQLSRLLTLYVDLFNKRDWDGLRDLIRSDARLRVADRFAGPMKEASYFMNYERQRVPWRLAVATVDGETGVAVLREDSGQWSPYSFTRVEIVDSQILCITDYIHCPWVLSAASSVVVSSS